MAFTLSGGPAVNGSAGAVSTFDITLPDVNVGDLIVVGVFSNSSTPRTVTSVACSGESNLTVLAGVTTFAQLNVTLAYLLSATAAGSKTITVTLSGVASFDTGGWAAAFTSPGPAVFDDETTGTGNSTTPSVSVGPTTKDGALLVGQAWGNASIAAGGGFTSVAITSEHLAEYDLDAGVVGSKTVNFTQTSDDWAVDAAAFSHAGVEGAGVFEQMTAMNDHGAASFEQMTASGRNFNIGSVTFEQATAAGIGREGATGAVEFQELSASGEALFPIVARLSSAQFEKMSAFGYVPHSGAAAFKELEASGIGRSFVVGEVSFEPMAVQWAAGHPRFEALQVAGQASEGLQETYAAKIMNTRTSAVTEFTNYKFNSFARIGKDYYGVGPDGLFRLDGVTDNGVNINWIFRTGRHDDKKPQMKRVPEIVLGLRSNGNVVVRVWSDDNTFNDYALPKVQTTTIHQHRVVPGKGLESRYFGVELRGTKNATLELDSMQVDMKELSTRLG